MSTKRKASRMMGGLSSEVSPMSSAWSSASGLPMEMLCTQEDSQQSRQDSPLIPDQSVKKKVIAYDEESMSSFTQEGGDVEKSFPFKNPNFVHSSKGTSNGKRQVWKSLKQILANEKALLWGPDDVTYASIEAPPSFKPAKKYSDLSGLPALYTDPHTKLRYATTDEFARIRVLPSDIVSGYLTLRKANPIVP